MSAMSIIINNSVFSLRTGTNVYCVKDIVLFRRIDMALMNIPFTSVN